MLVLSLHAFFYMLQQGENSLDSEFLSMLKHVKKACYNSNKNLLYRKFLFLL